MEEQPELFEEGTDNLGTEEKEKNAEKVAQMKDINAAITEAVGVLANEYGMKIYLVASVPKLDEMGVWKSNNVTPLEEMGLVQLIKSQF